MWKYAPAPGLLARKQDSETKWKLQPPSVLEGNMLQIKWGTSKNLLAVNTIGTVTVLNEHIMSAHMRDQVSWCNKVLSPLRMRCLKCGLSSMKTLTALYKNGMIYTFKCISC